MPTKNPRISVTFTAEDLALYEMVRRDAALYKRSESNQVTYALAEYYAAMKKQLEIFTQPQLREEKEEDIPIFETPSARPSLARVLKQRAAPGQGKI